MSLLVRTVPNAYKVAKLNPTFKKCENTDPSNYKPISLLPLNWKVLERVIYGKQMHSLKKTLLYSYQSECRTNHSTNLCLSFFTD